MSASAQWAQKEVWDMDASMTPWMGAIRYRMDGHGEPVVLLPVPMSTGWLQAGYTTALAPHCHLITLDADRGDHELDVGRLVGLLDAELLPRVHLWAYGACGRLAYEVAARHPDRVWSLLIGGFATQPGRPSRCLRDVQSPAVVYAGSRDPSAPGARLDAARLGAPFALLAGLSHEAAFAAVELLAPLALSHMLAVTDIGVPVSARAPACER